MVRHQISQTSGVKILPQRSLGARMERGFVSKSGAGDAGVVFLLLKSLGEPECRRASCASTLL